MGDTELNHCNTLIFDQYHGHSLLWKSFKGSLLIEGRGSQPQSMEKTFIGYGVDCKIYYYQKKAMVHKYETNWSSLVNKSIRNPMAYHSFKNHRVIYGLEEIIHWNIYNIWLRTVVKFKYIQPQQPSFFIMKNGWKAYEIPMDPWIINGCHGNETITLEVPLKNIYWTTVGGVHHLIITNKDVFMGQLLMFIVKKSTKSHEFSDVVYIVSQDYEIIDRWTFSLSGYFLMNRLEEKFHQFFMI